MKSLFIALTLFVSHVNAQCILKTASLGNFKTISGKEIRNCSLGYRTLGKLNADKSNVVLWPTWFTGQSEDICSGLTSMIMDTTGLYIIVVDAFGNGVSSSPSNTPGFPEITIRDMVNSQHMLLTKHLNIKHVKVVMGISMGGMQTLEWLVSYPDFADKAIAIEGTPKQSAYDLMLWKTEAALLTNVGKNANARESAIRMVSNISLLNIRTPSYWLHANTPEQVDSIMLAEQVNNLKAMKPEDWLCQLNAMIDHDIYKSSGKTISTVKDVIKTRTLVIVTSSDNMVNPGTSVELSNAIGATLVQLDNDCGHLGFLCDMTRVKDDVAGFLRK